MKIVIDRHIPFIEGVFDNICEVEYLHSSDINRDTVRAADCLIVRTRTRCDASLLLGSNVKLIASATAGYEHVDLDFCHRNGIGTFVARGCNASSVAQYVGSALAVWLAANRQIARDVTLGVVGYGYVGKEVEHIAKAMGLRVLLNDPPLEQQGYSQDFKSLRELAEECNVITFHTPLTESGSFATFHLVDSVFFEQCRLKPLIINAARGGVIDEQALMAAYRAGRIDGFVIDCWENEPNISAETLRNALIATPHIAGYSVNGKYNATRMCVEAVSDFFGVPHPKLHLDIPANICEARAEALAQELLKNYDIRKDSAALKACPDRFEYRRNNYPKRYEIKVT